MSITSVKRRFPVPLHALACQAFPYMDYSDAYSVLLPSTAPELTECYARAMFENPPRWVSLLTTLRDGIVSIFGLKTASALIKHGLAKTSPRGVQAHNARLGFSVLKRTESEILVGENDRHLDFRVSFLHSQIGCNTEICVVTTVKLNNWLGRIYFLPVKPLHTIIVPAMMRRAAKTINRNPASLK
jgi:hypothetical protein